MKLLYNIIFLFAISQLFFGCDKIIPDLERNNPHDTTFVGNNTEKIGVLNYYSQKVACKYSYGSTSYSEENTIKPGDRIFLFIMIDNPSSFNIAKIRATFSSTSNIVQLKQPSNGYYVKFSEGSSSNDYISSGKTGWGEITNGQYFIFAPNANSYAIEFLVSTSAISGNGFTIQMKLMDNVNNVWNENINLSVQ